MCIAPSVCAVRLHHQGLGFEAHRGGVRRPLQPNLATSGAVDSGFHDHRPTVVVRIWKYELGSRPTQRAALPSAFIDVLGGRVIDHGELVIHVDFTAWWQRAG